MEKINHPVSGESGFFVTDRQKNLIDIVFKQYVISQLVTTRSVSGVEYE